jgi:hypothetical protein
LIGMAKAMLAARDTGQDQIAAVERALGWKRLKELVAEADKAIANTREDNLGEIVDRYPTVRRMSPILLGAFIFRSWKLDDSLLAALDTLRALHAIGQKHLPSRPSMAFLKPAWRKLVKAGGGVDRRAYEVAVMTALRHRLSAGDVWVEGSRAFRAFDDFLLPTETFATRRGEGELGLAVADRFDDWRAERVTLLESRLREIDALAAAGNLPEATLTEEGLSISPIRKDESDESDNVARRLYAMLPASAHHRTSRRGARLDGSCRPVQPSANGSAAGGQPGVDDGVARRRHQSRARQNGPQRQGFSHSKLIWIAE